jgi:glycosyltransferase involved in cell wall biosynthesis
MKVALVHDYLREYGGAERVVEALHELYPDAPLYTAFVDWEALSEFGQRFKSWDIRTTWVDRNPIVKKWHSPLRFLTPLVWESLDLRGFDVVISSSGWYICRGVVTRPETVHISYIHHPPRNLYGFPTGRKPNGLIKAYAAFINPFLRVYDYAAMQRVDYVVANSQTTRERIQKFYRRDSTVIYPPVEVKSSKLKVERKRGDYFLIVGRLTYSKRVDLVIEACNELKLSLKIVGTGKEEEYLRSIARETIEFVGSVSDEELAKLYAGAKALIFCSLEEDFGIVPVEAMGHGVPVIALKQGGVRETVVEGKTGLFFNEPTKESLVTVLKKFESMKFDPETIHKRAEKFSKEVFQKKMKDFVEEKYQKQNKNYYASSDELKRGVEK